jgi:hypothetical protein
MQIRERGNRWQLLESFYDKEKKRSGQKQIASQETYHREIRPEVKEKLTDEQAVEFKAFLDEEDAKREVRFNTSKMSVIGLNMRRAAELLNLGHRFEDEDVSSDVDQVFNDLEELKKALRKAGYKRPQKPVKQLESKDDRQADLIPEKASEGV